VSKPLLLVAALAAVLGAATVPAAARPVGRDVPRPGARDGRTPVLLLAIDTLREDHLGCAGNDSVRTPHLDALAADGIRFSRCFAPAPWTLPSFASLFTGLIPWRHEAVGGDHAVLPDEMTTLAEILAADGYATAACVSVAYLTDRFGTVQGFTDKLQIGTGRRPDQQARGVTSRGLRYLDRWQRRPFLLFLHWFDVHAPYAPPAPYDRMYYAGDEKDPGRPLLLDFLLSDANRTRNRADGMYDWLAGVTDPRFPAAQYAAGVSYVDDHVGQVLARLRGIHRYDESLIVLVSDHGEHLGEHDYWYTHSQPYQETLHVPLILKLPGGRHAGTVVAEPVSLLDVLPTVLELLGRPVPEGLDGRSLAGLLAGAADGDVDASLCLAEKGGERDRHSKALVDWPWKLMYFREGESERYELFHLEDDPGETRDRSADAPDELARLRERLWSLIDPESPVVRSGLARPAELDPEAERRLRALGY
jgi:arylsulfatase A-like enzyme